MTVPMSVIISTYNSPQWLEKVLWGYSAQTHRDFEIVIADDGSTDETRQLIDNMRTQTGLPITHVWQRDLGFRKCRILNKSTQQARGEYLVFTDGDCIPRKDFLAIHANRAQKGHFLSGSYCKLPMSISAAIQQEDILSGNCFNFAWLQQRGLKSSRKNLKLLAKGRWAQLLNACTFTKCTFKGSNASAWRSDVLAVNGFDERLSYGGEDREFGARLINLGVQPRHVRYDAILLHLDHERSYAHADQIRENRRHRILVEKRRIVTTDHGIIQLGREQPAH